ncbi:ubiquitin carboxyl-terminal hydrolase 2 [Moelleriella libera RCEF 2490]|uniref:Ubiquitin carboxyl-terminal hydrolase n=1 Tax=Moelleriella libera RCEF 2490 TaxID=1081109 RepID=A0A168F214_9HYPO|nr:ubiquitin carboxyl-terminal hydrolase 2 [Moelleriella libera RCEF 2490]
MRRSFPALKAWPDAAVSCICLLTSRALRTTSVITVESDAGVFTSLVEELGVKGVQFEELFELEASELTALQPVYGVIFLFKYPTDEPYVRPDGPIDGVFDHAASERIFFAAQTIQNACATQALLSVVMNRGDDMQDIGDAMLNFRDFTMPLPPEFRGEALSNSDLIREVHNSFAKSSPFADETQKDDDAAAEDAFHFIAYTAVNGTLYELDGLQPAPIAHGPCDNKQFPAQVIRVIKRRVSRYNAAEIRFNLLAMCRDLRIRARDFGDEDLREREEKKRRDWHFENALRRHNFVGLAGEVLQGVVEAKLKQGGDAAVDKWIEDGLKQLQDMEGRQRLTEDAKRQNDGDVEMK